MARFYAALSLLLALAGCSFDTGYSEEDPMLRNRRHMHGEPPETDPRFIPDVAKLGRVAPTTSNWGSTARLLGATPNQTAKLLRLESDGRYPWIVSVSTLYGAGGTALVGVKVLGNFGTGGSFNRVEFDASPDQVIQLPGAALDLDVAWDSIFTGTAATSGGRAEETTLSGLPPTADVSGVACHGEVSRGSATRTRFFVTALVGNWGTPIPAYADRLFVAAQDADYGSISFMTFETASGAVMFFYTGAQLLALKNIGASIPIPGNAVTVRFTTTAGCTIRLAYELSL